MVEGERGRSSSDGGRRTNKGRRVKQGAGAGDGDDKGDLERFLALHKCGNLVPVFEEHGVKSVKAARGLTKKDLERFGMSKGLSTKLIKLFQQAGANAAETQAGIAKTAPQRKKADASKPAIIKAFLERLETQGAGKFHSLSFKQLETAAAEFLEPNQLDKVNSFGGVVAFCKKCNELYVNDKRSTISIHNNTSSKGNANDETSPGTKQHQRQKRGGGIIRSPEKPENGKGLPTGVAEAAATEKAALEKAANAVAKLSGKKGQKVHIKDVETHLDWKANFGHFGKIEKFVNSHREVFFVKSGFVAMRRTSDKNDGGKGAEPSTMEKPQASNSSAKKGKAKGEKSANAKSGNSSNSVAPGGAASSIGDHRHDQQDLSRQINARPPPFKMTDTPAKPPPFQMDNSADDDDDDAKTPEKEVEPLFVQNKKKGIILLRRNSDESSSNTLKTLPDDVKALFEADDKPLAPPKAPPKRVDRLNPPSHPPIVASQQPDSSAAQHQQLLAKQQQILLLQQQHQQQILLMQQQQQLQQGSNSNALVNAMQTFHGDVTSAQASVKNQSWARKISSADGRGRASSRLSGEFKTLSLTSLKSKSKSTPPPPDNAQAAVATASTTAQSNTHLPENAPSKRPSAVAALAMKQAAVNEVAGSEFPSLQSVAMAENLN